MSIFPKRNNHPTWKVSFLPCLTSKAIFRSTYEHQGIQNVLCFFRFGDNLIFKVTYSQIQSSYAVMRWLILYLYLQIACAIKEIVSKAGAESCPHIICGDFNSEPFSPGYLMAKDGYLSNEGTINKLQQLHNLQFPDGRVRTFSYLDARILYWIFSSCLPP